MTGALPATVTARRRSTGSRLGPLPMINVVTLEIGLALGLAVFAVDTALWWAALAMLLVAAPLALGRWRGRWLVLWAQLTARYLLRSRRRTVTSPHLVAAGHLPASPRRRPYSRRRNTQPWAPTIPGSPCCASCYRNCSSRIPPTTSVNRWAWPGTTAAGLRCSGWTQHR